MGHHPVVRKRLYNRLQKQREIHTPSCLTALLSIYACEEKTARLHLVKKGGRSLKKEGLLHKELLELVSTVGHGDYIMITDRGFPLPDTSYTHIIDLGLIPGFPDFNTVVKAILSEVAVDWLYFTRETKKTNPEMISFVKNLLTHNAGTSFMEHEDMKEALLNPESYHKRTDHLSKDDSRLQNQLLKHSRIIGCVRTGEFVKYTNILIECGVAF
jgi:D-ribose pyranase